MVRGVWVALSGVVEGGDYSSTVRNDRQSRRASNYH